MDSPLAILTCQAANDVIERGDIDSVSAHYKISRAGIYNIANGDTPNPGIKTAYALLETTNPSLCLRLKAEAERIMHLRHLAANEEKVA